MKRNITLDYTKLFLSFLVVIIHNPIFTDFRYVSTLIVNGLARVAVPCFFVLNGLYLGKVLSDKSSFKKYIRKLFTYYVVWMLIYSPFYLFGYKNDIITSVILNISNILFGFWHLWYIIALIGGVMCLYYLRKKNFSDNKILLLAVLLFLVGWMIQKVELFYPNGEGLIGLMIRSSFPSRNFLFMGFPFVAIGYLISKEDFLKKLKSNFSNIYILLLLFILLFAETTLHFLMIGRRGFDFYLALIILCPAFIVFLRTKSKTINVEDDFISKLSAAIYFIHPLVLYFTKSAFPDFLSTERYVLILFFSIVFGSALIYANKRLKIFF